MKKLTITLKQKLQFIVAAFSVLVLIIGFITLYWYASLYFHQKLQSNLEVLAKVLADNSRAALTFNDEASAHNILKSSMGNPQIEMAAIRKNGSWFAIYPPDRQPDPSLLTETHVGVRLLKDHYIATIPISDGLKQVGSLVLQSNLQEWEEVQYNLFTVFAGLFICLLVATIFVSYLLNNHITRPLADLASWATTVSRTKDFNARAKKINDDEIGTLVDSLNTMLADLASRESILAWNKILEEEIQERKQVEKDLIDMRNNAEAANRAKSQFLANMSHELRTPLNAIIGYSEMVFEILSEDNVDPAEIAGDIDKIRAAGRHLLSLINDILDLSKIEAGKMDLNIESIDTKTLVTDAINTIKPLAEIRKNRLSVSIEDNLGEIHTDIIKVRQILFNMLSNAVKFTENGKVSLQCYRSMENDSDNIVFEISDTGIGISEESLKHLFRPFTQADTSTTRRFGGTGLGLAICSSYAQMLGGSIKVRSTLGSGSTFIISLPHNIEGARRPTEDQQPDAISTLMQETFAKKTRVLLIDDDESVHSILEFQLSRHGFEITSAFSGADGLRKAMSDAFDVIVLDIIMPEMDGWQVLQAIKSSSHSREIPVVLYTIVAESEKGFALGAADYLVKPISKQHIIATLQRFNRSSQRKNILIIDDDSDTHRLFKSYLANTEAELLSAYGGSEGLDLITQRGDIDLILLDLIMPEMNGFEFIENFYKLRPHKDIPIIVVSARDLSSTERELLLHHVDMIITKGICEKDELIGHILHLLDQNNTLSTDKGGVS